MFKKLKNNISILCVLFISYGFSESFEENYLNDDKKDSMVEELELIEPCLVVQKIDNAGIEITLTDGSVWSLDPNDSVLGPLKLVKIHQNSADLEEVSDMSDWEKGDNILFLYPSSDYSNFEIINSVTREKAVVFLKKEPSLQSSSSLWLVSSNKKKDVILLNNRKSYKKINPNNLLEKHLEESPINVNFEDWQAGDVVTVLELDLDIFCGSLNQEEKELNALWNHSTNEIVICEKIENDFIPQLFNQMNVNFRNISKDIHVYL